jgi:hypothetical protein
MPWFRQPIARSVIQPDPSGPFRMNLRAVIALELERRPGDWMLMPDAILDTGASLCIFSAAWARANGFTLPLAYSALSITTAAGPVRTRVYDVDLNARFRRMPECSFSLAVVFSERHPPNVSPLIGLHNLLNSWRVTFDGAQEPAALMGHMRFETLDPLRTSP